MTLSLRSYCKQDFACLSDIRTDLAMQHMLLANPDPGANMDVASWIERRVKTGTFRIIIQEHNREAALGFVQLDPVHHKNRYGWFGIALHPRAQGKGYGYAAMKALHNWARDDMNLRKLLLEVRVDNKSAIALYDKLGYRKAGELKAQYFDGFEYWDTLIMERELRDA